MKPAILLLLILSAFLAACAGGQMAGPAAPQAITATPLPRATVPAASETAAPTQTAAPAPSVEVTPAPPTPTATLTPEPEVTPETSAQPLPVQLTSGQTEEGAYFLGDPSAPLTLIDYSDFL